MADVPSVGKIIGLLQTGRRRKDLIYAMNLLAFAFEHTLDAHSVVGNHLVPLLVDCGSLPDAQHVFDRLPYRNSHSSTSLISAYIDCAEPHNVSILYLRMQQDSFPPNSHTFVALLRACNFLKDLGLGRQLHVEAIKHGLDMDPYIGSCLVDMLAKCGSLADAWDVFNRLQVSNVVSWTALIAGYTDHGRGAEAWSTFERMQSVGVCPDAVAYVCGLKSCASLAAIDRGQLLHAGIVKMGFETDVFIGSTLVDMYAKSGAFDQACDVFNHLAVRNVVSWTAIVGGYADKGLDDEAFKSLQDMNHEGVSPNASTYVCSLKACGGSRALENGRRVYVEVAKRGLERDHLVGNSLVDMFCKCGSLKEANMMFDCLLVHDVVSWTALLTGYCEQGLCEEALSCFERMQLEGVPPNDVAHACILKACESVGMVERGREVHGEVVRRGLSEDLVVANTLIDMLSKIY